MFSRCCRSISVSCRDFCQFSNDVVEAQVRRDEVDQFFRENPSRRPLPARFPFFQDYHSLSHPEYEEVQETVVDPVTQEVRVTTRQRLIIRAIDLEHYQNDQFTRRVHIPFVFFGALVGVGFGLLILKLMKRI